jgi:hypothetical protein
MAILAHAAQGSGPSALARARAFGSLASSPWSSGDLAFRGVLDDFPTLEAVAALGVVIAAVRAYLIHTLAASSARLHLLVLEFLEAGKSELALAACESSPSRAYPRVAEQVIRAAAAPDAASEPVRLREQLGAVFEQAFADESQRIQSGRARDLVVLGVLVGAALYARASGLDVSPVFFALLAVGSTLFVWTVFSRRRVLDITRSARDALIEAAARRVARSARSSIAEGCALCGSLDSIVVTDPQRANLTHLGIDALRICRNCGHVVGEAADPAAIAVGPEHGTELAFHPPSSAGEALSEGEEPQG